MDGDRIARALARIEAAAGRIEAAARPSALAVERAGADPELADKYQTLRREAGAALADLESLIGSLER